MSRPEINQCALFVSSSDKHPDEIINLIIGDVDDVPYQIDEGDITAYPWHVSTKYYEADVYLCSMASKSLVPHQFMLSIQAVILFFDSNKNDGLELAESWLPFLNEYAADVKIMLCNRCLEKPVTGVSKISAQEWCIKKGFELVELDPEIDESDMEQDFVEANGIKRVIQALHAHVWPDFTITDREEPKSFSSLLHGGLSHHSVEGDLSEELEGLNLSNGLDQANVEGKIEELFGGGLPDEGMDFSTLFGQLQEMKDQVASMPTDQRKACAEQVVLAFWKAIGGDNEEIDIPEDG